MSMYINHSATIPDGEVHHPTDLGKILLDLDSIVDWPDKFHAFHS